jgi:vanillate/3-O-methylgallate O-demethylase
MGERKDPRTLQELLDSVPSIVDYLYSNPKGQWLARRHPPHLVPPEFTNWRDEQRAWRETVALYDQSYHMTMTYVRGPDALPLFCALGVNRFTTFGPGRARHFVACAPSGHVIGDGVLYCLRPEEVVLVGGAAPHHWVQFHAQTGGWRVTVERDESYARNPTGRRTVYRYQVEGPRSPQLMEALNRGPLPELRPFQIAPIRIAGHTVWALRHTMAGGPGFELFGPWEEGPSVREAILEAGKAFGLRQVGTLAYFTTGVDLGWIPRVLPAIYTGEELRPFREWLPATSGEATWSLGGSFYSPNVEDYYLTPWELGYGHLVHLDHEFVGREALARMASQPHRRKVTLVWGAEDVAEVFTSFLRPGLPARYLDLPLPTYSVWQYDAVLDERETLVGISTYVAYSWNERALLSLAVVSAEFAEPGKRVTVVWGEPEGGAKSRPWLEPHRQVRIRATVAPAPINPLAREHPSAVRR